MSSCSSERPWPESLVSSPRSPPTSRYGGSRILWADDHSNLYTIAADGSAQRLLTDGTTDCYEATFYAGRRPHRPRHAALGTVVAAPAY